MKVEVLQRFGDIKDFAKKYEVGQIYEFDDDRAKGIIARGLAKEAKAEKVKSEKTAKEAK